MCTSKKLLFSTRSYRLRKWIETQYNAVLYKAITSNSYYYFIKLNSGKSYKIRISDHFSNNNNSTNDYSIIIAYNPHNINQNVYLISQLPFEKNVIAITDFKELKYDINRAIISFSFYNSYLQSLETRTKIAVQKQNEYEITIPETVKNQNETSDVIVYDSAPENNNFVSDDIIENHIQFPDKEMMIHMNDRNRTTNNAVWCKLCLQIPGWLKFPKPIKKAIRDLFNSKIDFLDGCKFIDENKKLTTANFMIALYKKRNEYLNKTK